VKSAYIARTTILSLLKEKQRTVITEGWAGWRLKLEKQRRVPKGNGAISIFNGRKFLIARPTYFLGGKSKKKLLKKIQNDLQRRKYFNLQAHDLVLVAPIILNYY